MSNRKNRGGRGLFGNDDDIFGKSSTDSRAGSDFMSDLLGSGDKAKRPASTASTREFVFDNKYKKDTAKKEDGDTGGYAPSNDGRRAISAGGKKNPLDDIFGKEFDFKTAKVASESSGSSGDSGRARPRRRPEPAARGSFEIDDSDIIGDIKPKKQQETEQHQRQDAGQTETEADLVASMLGGGKKASPPKGKKSTTSGPPKNTQPDRNSQATPFSIPLISTPALEVHSLGHAGRTILREH